MFEPTLFDDVQFWELKALSPPWKKEPANAQSAGDPRWIPAGPRRRRGHRPEIFLAKAKDLCVKTKEVNKESNGVGSMPAIGDVVVAKKELVEFRPADPATRRASLKLWNRLWVLRAFCL